MLLNKLHSALNYFTPIIFSRILKLFEATLTLMLILEQCLHQGLLLLGAFRQEEVYLRAMQLDESPGSFSRIKCGCGEE